MLGTGMPVLNPISAAWNTVGRFDDYESAQRAVDRLSDDGFPVENLDIVGSGLRLVERVTGRLRGLVAAGRRFLAAHHDLAHVRPLRYRTRGSAAA